MLRRLPFALRVDFPRDLRGSIQTTFPAIRQSTDDLVDIEPEKTGQRDGTMSRLVQICPLCKGLKR